MPAQISMLSETRKLRVGRAVGHPGGPFADVAPWVVAIWRAWGLSSLSRNCTNT
jgi:hypothetical protein